MPARVWARGAGSLVVGGVAGLENDDSLTFAEGALGGQVLDGGEGRGALGAEAEAFEAGGAGRDRGEAVFLNGQGAAVGLAKGGEDQEVGDGPRHTQAPDAGARLGPGLGRFLAPVEGAHD